MIKIGTALFEACEELEREREKRLLAVTCVDRCSAGFRTDCHCETPLFCGSLATVSLGLWTR